MPTFARINTLSGIEQSSKKPSGFGAPAFEFSRKATKGDYKIPVPEMTRQESVKSDESSSDIKNMAKNSTPHPDTAKAKPLGPVKDSHPSIVKAKPLCSVLDYRKAWQDENDPFLRKIRKLAYNYNCMMSKSSWTNPIDTLYAAAYKINLRINFSIKYVKGNDSSPEWHFCTISVENIMIASGDGYTIKDSKTYARKVALQKILMPYLRVIDTHPAKTKMLDASDEPFSSIPESSDTHTYNPQINTKDLPSVDKEKRHQPNTNMVTKLDEFVIVEPLIPSRNNPTHILKSSADFNHMILTFEYMFKRDSFCCVSKLDNDEIADATGMSKQAAQTNASSRALEKLKRKCWGVKTKKAFDSNSKMSKDDFLNELNDQTDCLQINSNGNKNLSKNEESERKKEEDIVDSVTSKSVLNRENLGLNASKEITDQRRQKIKDVIEKYTASPNQEDLVFANDFEQEEKDIISEECRRLDLKCVCRDKPAGVICVGRKKSMFQLFQLLMSVGGETVNYKLVPPAGTDRVVDNPNKGNTRQALSKLKAINSRGASSIPSRFSNWNSREASSFSSNTRNVKWQQGYGISPNTDGFSVSMRHDKDFDRAGQKRRAPFPSEEIPLFSGPTHSHQQYSSPKRQKSSHFANNFNNVPFHRTCNESVLSSAFGHSGCDESNHTRFPNSDVDGRSLNAARYDSGSRFHRMNDNTQDFLNNNVSGRYRAPDNGFNFPQMDGGRNNLLRSRIENSAGRNAVSHSKFYHESGSTDYCSRSSINGIVRGSPDTGYGYNGSNRRFAANASCGSNDARRSGLNNRQMVPNEASFVSGRYTQPSDNRVSSSNYSFADFLKDRQKSGYNYFSGTSTDMGESFNTGFGNDGSGSQNRGHCSNNNFERVYDNKKYKNMSFRSGQCLY